MGGGVTSSAKPREQSVLAQNRPRKRMLCRASRKGDADVEPHGKASQHCQRPLPSQGYRLLRTLPSLFISFHFPRSSWDISSPAMTSDPSCRYPFEPGLWGVNYRGFGPAWLIYPTFQSTPEWQQVGSRESLPPQRGEGRWVRAAQTRKSWTHGDVMAEVQPPSGTLEMEHWSILQSPGKPGRREAGLAQRSATRGL